MYPTIVCIQQNTNFREGTQGKNQNKSDCNSGTGLKAGQAENAPKQVKKVNGLETIPE